MALRSLSTIMGRKQQDRPREAQGVRLSPPLMQTNMKIPDRDHSDDTLRSQYVLAETLYKEQKYQEAEEMFCQVVQGQDKTYGNDHSDTLRSKYMLAVTLYNQQKYQDAEEMFYQVVQGKEKTLGNDNSTTLWGKTLLALTLYNQQKYQDAEEICRQAVQGQERALGKNHSHTLDSKQLLQKILDATPSTVIDDTPSNPVDRLRAFFPMAEESRPPYNDAEIYEISALLKQINVSWSRVPRTYIILRNIGCLYLLDKFISVGFSDYWFPVDETTLPDCLDPVMRARFMGVQQLVLTKSMDLEKSDGGQHQYFKKGEPLPFEKKRILGAGGFGQVDQVLSLISFKEYARKRVPRKAALGGRGREAMKGIVAEIEIMKKLKHNHIVEFMGSYTDHKYLGLIMSPVAEMDLSVYLRKAESSQHGEIRTFFGCLATALQFLHSNQIRHKDIKPANILVHRGKVLLTDFGLALDFTDASGSTTVGMTNGISPKYCAPEVVLHEPRNTSSDIWSLGVVFLEMTIILKDRTIEWMDRYFKTHGSQQAYARSNLAGLEELITELERTGNPVDNQALIWIRRMLQLRSTSRLTASHLVTLITSPDGRINNRFCGFCCLYPDHDDSSDLESETE